MHPCVPVRDAIRKKGREGTKSGRGGWKDARRLWTRNEWSGKYVDFLVGSKHDDPSFVRVSVDIKGNRFAPEPWRYLRVSRLRVSCLLFHRRTDHRTDHRTQYIDSFFVRFSFLPSSSIKFPLSPVRIGKNLVKYRSNEAGWKKTEKRWMSSVSRVVRFRLRAICDVPFVAA